MFERAPASTDQRRPTLLGAYDAKERHPAFDGRGIELEMEFELLALEAGLDPDQLAGADRPEILRHQRRIAGRKGGLSTFARYGKPYMRALARSRWGTTPKGALPAIREILREDNSPNEPSPTSRPRSAPRSAPKPTASQRKKVAA